MTKRLSVVTFVLISALLSSQHLGADSVLQIYRCPPDLSGELRSAGSSTMRKLMIQWGEEFAKFCPKVRLRVGGGGSAAGPRALMDGTADLAAMSRPMKTSEVLAFEKQYGFNPTELMTALDALSIWVHQDNPIKGIMLSQLDAVYSETRLRGYGEDITTWGQLGLTGEWSNQEINIYGLPSVSGTQEFFKKQVLLNGSFKFYLEPLPGPGYMVQAAADDRQAITYSGMGYRIPGVRAVSLATGASVSFHQPGYEEIVSGKYPLKRFLYIYIVNGPAKPVLSIVREFAKFVFSQYGQRVVSERGYLPLPISAVKVELEKLKLTK